MQRVFERATGIIAFLIGVVLILGSLSGITGFVILENIRTNAASIVGLVFVVGGIILFLSAKGKNIAPSKLEEMATALNISKSPDLEVLPDTEFIKEGMHEPGKKHSAINMSGYQLVLLKQVLEECKRQKVPQNIRNYLISNHVTSKTVENPKITRQYKNLIKNTWIDYCNREYEGSRSEEWKNILSGADAPLLVYALQRGEKPTLILSNDTHLEKLAPELNRLTGSNIIVRGLRDYHETVR